VIQTSLFELINAQPPAKEKENPVELYKAFTAASCSDCRLGLQCPSNPGFLHAGVLNAKVVFLYDLPTMNDLRAGKSVSANSWSYDFDKYLKTMNLNWGEILVTGLAQCPLDGKLSEGMNYKKAANEYLKDIKTCFYSRTLPFLKSLPHMEVLVLMGWTVPKLLFGGNPGPKTHEGEWFSTPTFPGVAVFCIDHPRNLPGENKKIGAVLEWRNRRHQCLSSFSPLYKSGKIHKILKCYESHQVDGSSVDLETAY
jgi:hypothetical protein